MSRLMTMMLLIIFCSLMLTLRGLMPYLPANVLEVCPTLPTLPVTVFAISVVVFWKRSGQTEQQGEIKETTKLYPITERGE